jgi:hypothetical protein
MFVGLLARKFPLKEFTFSIFFTLPIPFAPKLAFDLKDFTDFTEDLQLLFELGDLQLFLDGSLHDFG